MLKVPSHAPTTHTHTRARDYNALCRTHIIHITQIHTDIILHKLVHTHFGHTAAPILRNYATIPTATDMGTCISESVSLARHTHVHDLSCRSRRHHEQAQHVCARTHTTPAT